MLILGAPLHPLFVVVQGFKKGMILLNGVVDSSIYPVDKAFRCRRGGLPWDSKDGKILKYKLSQYDPKWNGPEMVDMAEIEKGVCGVLRNMGFNYLYFAIPVLKKFGMEGEKTIRRALRAYSRSRGTYLREWHGKEGLPINLKSAARTWFLIPAHDEATGRADPRPSDEVVSPYYVAHKIPSCPMHDVLKEEGVEHYGYIYCDEVHLEVIKAYDTNAVVEIHENLMKGDEFCDFVWWMKPPHEIPEEKIDWSGYESLEKREKANPVQTALFYLKKDTWDVIGKLYYYLADASINRFGDEGKRMVKSALIEMGRRRGRELKEKLEKDRKDITWKNIFDNFDLPYKLVWKMKVEASNHKFIANVEYCPLAEIWNGLENKELGPMWCETMYTSMFKELFNEEGEIKIPQCLTEGANKCRFKFKI